MILAELRGQTLNPTGPQGASSTQGIPAEAVRKPAGNSSHTGLAATVGSSWDLSQSPDLASPAHLAEWIEGSAAHPALAAANLQTLAGSDAVQAIAGDRLETLGAHGQQYATAPVQRLLQALEPVTEAGGWWCSGLDPLADWAPMAWGQFKPNRPRLADGKTLKYEAPHGIATRSAWLRVPAVVAQLVADRFGLALPATVAADTHGNGGAFWRWWATEPRLPLLVTEGAKKAAALLSAGIPAVALPGIDNGAKRTGPKGADGRRTGPKELLADLAAVPLEGRPVWVLFDHTDSRKGRCAVKAAYRSLGRLLAKAGAAAVLVGAVPPGPHKGADDWLAAGRNWAGLAQALEPITAEPVLPRLRHADVVAPAGRWLGDACPIPTATDARLVALAAPMGAGKTEAIAAALAPLMAVGVRVVLVTHRRSLGAALADRLGLPWGDDAAPGSDLRQQGVALCIDSLCPNSGLQIRPGDWRGCIVVMDEAAAVMAHAVNGTGTAIAKRRSAVLETLAELLAGASQVIVADAQLSDNVLDLFEAATGTRAHLIASEHRPAEGRRLTVHPTRDSWRAELVTQLQDRRRLWIATTAKDEANGAQTLAMLTMQNWPTARVLVVDSDTVADDRHDASRLAADPNGIAAAYDVVIATPAVAAGLSVTLRGHFEVVMGIAGGTTDADAVAQALARVRDDCPRHLFAPERSPGAWLQTGSGDLEADQLLHHLAKHEAAAVMQLLAAGGNLEQGTTGPWLQLWGRLGAHQNRQRLAYRATVVGLLEREGYEVTQAQALDAEGIAAANAAADDLRAIAADVLAAADRAVIAAEPISNRQAAELEKKQRRTPAEKAQLARWRTLKTWGDAPLSPELLEATRQGDSKRFRFGWLLGSIEGRQLAAQHDLAAAKALAPTGRAWAPDLCREMIGPRLAVADALGLADWLQRGDWFEADDAELTRLQTRATAHSSSLTQALGIRAGVRASGTLRALLRLAGYRLEAARHRLSDGRRGWRYRVVPEALPPGVDRQRLEGAWREQLSTPAL